MHLYFAPNIEEELCLPPDESLHCAKVLRQKAEDRISIIDGKGTYYDAEIVSAHQKRTLVKLLKRIENWNAREFRLHMAVCPTKSMDRFEWFLEKATEIGVDEITPILGRYSERKTVKPERLNRIVVAASKQSYKAAIPVVNELTRFADFMNQDLPKDSFMAHCYEDESKQPLLKTMPARKEVLILVGPEGDFSEEEVAMARAKGIQMVSLGESRLRTETAGVVACHIATVVNSL